MQKINREQILASIEQSDFILKSTHHKLCLPIINRIYIKMKQGIKFDSIKVCDEMIIDGHHRYICSLLTQIDLGTVKSLKTSATVEYNWNEVEFVEEDWDTEEEIKHFNALDAAYNKIPKERLEELIKVNF